MKKIIHFLSEKQYGGLGKPLPVKSVLPEWYRLSETTFKRNGEEFPGLKKCVPFLDAMLVGYVITTPFDIHVSRKENKLDVRWDGPVGYETFIIQRDARQGEKIPRPAGHLPDHLAFQSKWGWKVPKGYSVLVLPPLNRFELPFTITSGVIDSDEFWTNGNIPFFMREDFEGVIPAGTPIAQLIPYKREEWAHVENNQTLIPESRLLGSIVRNKNTSYKKALWHRKKFD